MKKKSVIILGSVVAICGLGLVASHFMDWPVDSSDASGDIAKSDRFSRKQASEKLTNMEELLQADSDFKDGIVAAQVVMQTRAAQFASLVDMSNEVAGNIPEFEGLLKEMNAASEMVANVNNSLMESGEDLNAALGGDECPDLTQKTINASLAYTTLQKQNKLADRFIETTDKYLETAQGNDRLKFVRDQWLEYQQVTAALEGNKENADKLAEKGNLLTAEKSLAALASFGPVCQMSVINTCYMSQQINVPTGLGNQIPQQMIEQVVTGIQNAAKAAIKQTANGAMENSHTTLRGATRIVTDPIRNTATEAIAKAFTNATGAYAKSLGQAYKEGLNQANKEGLNQTQRGLGQSQRSLSQTQGSLSQTNKDAIADLAVIGMASAQNVVSAFGRALSQQAGKEALQQSQGVGLCNTIGNVIKETSIGQRAEVHL